MIAFLTGEAGSRHAGGPWFFLDSHRICSHDARSALASQLHTISSLLPWGEEIAIGLGLIIDLLHARCGWLVQHKTLRFQSLCRLKEATKVVMNIRTVVAIGTISTLGPSQ